MARMNWGEDLAAQHARFGSRIGIIDADGHHSIADVIDHAAGIADHLRAIAVAPGDFIATCFHNSALAASASHAVSLSGAAEVPINPALSPGEIAHALACTGARLVLVDGRDHPEGIAGAESLDLRQIAPRAMQPTGWPDVEAEAPSRIVFTSGTTGPAKGAIHSHRGRWTGTLMLRAALPLLADGSNRFLLMTPFSHGTSLLTFAAMAEGASVHLLRGVAPEVVLPLLQSGSITEMFAPPTVLAKLTGALEEAGRCARDWGLRNILTGTAPLSPALQARARAVFGPIIRVTYGKSEIFNPITVLDPAETAAVYDEGEAAGEGLCVGWPAPGVRISIRDEAGKDLPAGQVGQIHLHSPHLSLGYMTRDGERRLGPDDYHDTGDLGRIDARGRLFLVSRQSDMMKSGGYKVSPDEVERALAQALPGVELVVLGCPSDYWGDIVTVIAENPPADWRERLAPAIAAMTSYKRPRLLAEIATLPRNSIGKIARVHLRQWLIETHELIERPRPALIARGTPP